MDLLLDRDVKRDKHDLIFLNGYCPTTTDRIDVVIQRIYVKLRTHEDEWYLNVQYGVPWLSKILGHKVKKSTVDMILQEKILEEDGVSQIVSFSSTLDNPTREYRCTFRVKADDGVISNEIIF